MFARERYRSYPRTVPRTQQVYGPVCLPIGGKELAAQRGVWSNPDDAEVRSRVNSATNQVERYLGRSIVARTFDVLIDDLDNPEYIEIPRRPLLGVVAFSWRNTDGTYKVQDPATYWISEASDPGRIGPVYGSSWASGFFPSTFFGGTRFESFRIRVVAGYVYPFKVQPLDDGSFDGTLWSPNHALVEGQVVRVSRGLNDQVPGQLYEDTDYIVVNVAPNTFMLLDYNGNLLQSQDQQGNWSFIGEIPENIRRAIIITASHTMEFQGTGDKSARFNPTTLPEEAIELLKYDRVIAI